MGRPFRVTLRRGKTSTYVISAGEPLRFGYAWNNDLVARGAGVDDHHGTFATVGGVLVLMELTSGFPTRQRGRAVSGLVVLQPGDALQVGPFELVVGFVSAAEVRAARPAEGRRSRAARLRAHAPRVSTTPPLPVSRRDDVVAHFTAPAASADLRARPLVTGDDLRIDDEERRDRIAARLLSRLDEPSEPIPV